MSQILKKVKVFVEKIFFFNTYPPKYIQINLEIDDRLGRKATIEMRN